MYRVSVLLIVEAGTFQQIGTLRKGDAFFSGVMIAGHGEILLAGRDRHSGVAETSQ